MGESKTYSFRISKKMKFRLDQMTPAQKKRLNERLQYECARALHEFEFDAEKYMHDEEDGE